MERICLYQIKRFLSNGKDRFVLNGKGRSISNKK